MDSTFGLEIYASNKLFYTGRARSLVIRWRTARRLFSPITSIRFPLSFREKCVMRTQRGTGPLLR